MSAHVEEFTDARGRDVGTRFCLLEVYFKPEPGKVENLGEPWRTLENLGEPWRTLENLGEPWRTLENLGEPWRTLENLGEPVSDGKEYRALSRTSLCAEFEKKYPERLAIVGRWETRSGNTPDSCSTMNEFFIIFLSY
ncbi:MAG: hypothetical protein ACTSU9_15920 [Promethearchaeota archaeon]